MNAPKDMHVKPVNNGFLAVILFAMAAAWPLNAQVTVDLSVNNLYTDTFNSSGVLENITPISGAFTQSIVYDLSPNNTTVDGGTSYNNPASGAPLTQVFNETVSGIESTASFAGTPEDALVENYFGGASNFLIPTTGSLETNVFADVASANTSDLLRDGDSFNFTANSYNQVGNTLYSLNYDFQIDNFNSLNSALVPLVSEPLNNQANLTQLLNNMTSLQGYFAVEGVEYQVGIAGSNSGFDVRGNFLLNATPEPRSWALGVIAIATVLYVRRLRGSGELLRKKEL